MKRFRYEIRADRCKPTDLNGWPVWITNPNGIIVSSIVYKRLLPYAIVCNVCYGLVSIFWVTVFSLFYYDQLSNNFFLGWVPVQIFMMTAPVILVLLVSCWIFMSVNYFVKRLMPPWIVCGLIVSFTMIPSSVCPLFLLTIPSSIGFTGILTFVVPSFVIGLALGTVFGIKGADQAITRIKKPLPPFRIGIGSIMAIIVCLGIASAIDQGRMYFVVAVAIFVFINVAVFFVAQRIRQPKTSPVDTNPDIPHPTSLAKKSTTHQIRRRFDQEVERFSNLETGQVSTIDAPLAMELITQAAIAATDPINDVLDIGCGAGNNTIKLRQSVEKDFNVTLVDLSRPMLKRAKERIQKENRGDILLICDDFRDTILQSESYDVIIAAAVLHHLRSDFDWRSTFAKMFRLLRPGGSLWITDLVDHQSSQIQKLMWDRYGDYLESVGGKEYRQNVFQYIDIEDSPRSVTFQMELLKEAGFSQVEILHKNSCFAAFGAIK